MVNRLQDLAASLDTATPAPAVPDPSRGPTAGYTRKRFTVTFEDGPSGTVMAATHEEILEQGVLTANDTPAAKFGNVIAQSLVHQLKRNKITGTITLTAEGEVLMVLPIQHGVIGVPTSKPRPIVQAPAPQ